MPDDLDRPARSAGAHSLDQRVSSSGTPGGPEHEPTVIPEATDPRNAHLSEFPPGMLLGPYRIIAKLGQGGMGAVYKAVHIRLEKTVAVKVLAPDLVQQPESVARFEREMRAVGKLDHPHIVRAMDAGEIAGVHYLVMEFVAGTDLATVVRDRGVLTVPNACKVIRQVAQALTAAHAAHLIHRDLKPSNLLLETTGKVKVLDLGLARLADEAGQRTELTGAGQTFGTPDYMAPEQWSDTHAADPRTDLYALGCTLFFLLVGRAPYATESYRSSSSKMKGHVLDAIPDLRQARSGVPEGLCEIYQRLMAKAPEQRFQSAAELAEAITPFATSRPATQAAGATSASSQSIAPAKLASEPLPQEPAAVGPTRVMRSPTTGNGKRRRSGRRALATVAGAASLAILAAVVMTLTHRDGTRSTVLVPAETQVALQKVPEGTRAPVSEGAAAASRPQEAVDTTEPPPLEDWIRNRTILTVAHDGSGRFKSIQAALDHLAGGQVIQVLDRGPYRETLVADLPPDCGLISTATTVLEVPEWQLGWTEPSGPEGKIAEIYQGHRFSNATGFRLQGFEFRYPSPVGRWEDGKWHRRLSLRHVRNALVEDCAIRRVGNADGDPVEVSNVDSDVSTEMRAVIRECLIEGSLAITTNRKLKWEPGTKGSRIELLRNCFPESDEDHQVIVAGESLQQLSVRECLFSGRCHSNLVLIRLCGQSSVDVRQCLLNSQLGLIFSESIPGGPVILQNNLRIGEGLVTLQLGAEQGRALAQETWRVGHNGYAFVSGGEAHRLSRYPTDTAVRPEFQSLTPGHPAAFRLVGESPLGTAGAGEGAPSYIGPFPPGPPPENGDWFTRLSIRWESPK